MLCPIVITSTIYAYFHHHWVEPKLNVYNWGAALLALTISARALEYAFLPAGQLKVGETAPGKLGAPAISSGMPNGNHKEDTTPNSSPDSLLIGFRDAMEVLCAMRGIGWTTGTDVYIPKRHQTTFRLAMHCLFGFLSLDFLDSIFKLFPQFSTPSGGSIFDPNLPPPLRYLESTLLHFMTGCGFMAGFEFIYSLLALIAIGLFGHNASSWPAILDKPWISGSLHEFWAHRWHQLLRQTFLVFGGFPLAYVFSFNRTLSNFGLIFGTFFASGLFHNLSIYTMGAGTSHHITVFFTAQAFGLIAERMWRKVTGHRVGGWWGTAWVYLCIIGCGQMCIDAFHRRGLGGGLIVPPALSPFRQIVLPLLLRAFA